MIKYCLKKWDENKDELELVLRRYSKINECCYLDLVKLVTKHILGDKWDYEKITEIGNGDYQGTILFLIPMKTYEPAEYEYLATFVSYGSCPGCDTLQAIQDWSDRPDTEEQIKDFMALCKDLVTNMRKPFNCGWRNEPEFDEVVWEGGGRMSDLISRSALIKELQKCFVNNAIHKNDLAEVIANAPTAYDVNKVVHGKWEFQWFDSICSVCGFVNKAEPITRMRTDWEFCPNCGAKMDGKEEGAK